MSGRIVVVTGATGGLGPAVVEAFESAGDRVIPVSSKIANLTDAAQAAEFFTRTGHVDVLAHVMGGFADGTDHPEVWRRMFDLNFHAALYTILAALPRMKAAGSGRIIAVGSRTGEQLTAGLGAYGVSKAALHALIRQMALELKDTGITVNAVLPGTIDTAANRSWGTAGQAATWVKPQSVANAILWLASDAASEVNGALVPVYGRS
jgi:NAD(P)-dependent dehydrogenase (short-subunit alcohol dehydrogenase family)